MLITGEKIHWQSIIVLSWQRRLSQIESGEEKGR